MTNHHPLTGYILSVLVKLEIIKLLDFSEKYLFKMSKSDKNQNLMSPKLYASKQFQGKTSQYLLVFVIRVYNSLKVL